jgi:hypothetical protein
MQANQPIPRRRANVSLAGDLYAWVEQQAKAEHRDTPVDWIRALIKKEYAKHER